MKYIKVKWNHEASEALEPVLLYSELDESNWETRKVEIFENGTSQYADSAKQTGDTKLSLEELPSIEDINAQKKFEAVEIQKEEFERVWELSVNS